MGRTRPFQRELERAEQKNDAAEQPAPEDAAAVHRARELKLLAQVDVEVEFQHLIDRVTTAELFELVLEHASPGEGAFVDVGSGRVTANVVAYVALVWPNQFTAIHAVDVEQSRQTILEVQDMRRRVGGVRQGVSVEKFNRAVANTGQIAWWYVPTPDDPDAVITAFTGAATSDIRIANLFATATFVFSVDLLFTPEAVRGYRRHLAASLADSREVIYVSCNPIGGRQMRTAEFGERVLMRSDGTSDDDIGPYIRWCTKILAKGNGVHVAWGDTVFYIVMLQGPRVAAEVHIAKDTPMADAAVRDAQRAIDTVVRDVYSHVTRFTQLLDHQVDEVGETRADTAAAAAAAAAVATAEESRTSSLGYGELTEQAATKLISELQTDDTVGRQLGACSRFLDIGSGFGKMVFNVALRVPRISAVAGIEMVQTRHTAAVSLLEILRKKHPDWIDYFNTISLTFGDARTDVFDISSFTHIFLFDAIFDEDTHRDLFKRLAHEATRLRVLVCFCNEQKLRARGWPMDEAPLKFVRRLQLGTSGGQRFKANIYHLGSDDE